MTDRPDASAPGGAKMELLAPAGDMDSLIAAIEAGADAVYLGGKALNARKGAGNFDGEELLRAAQYCHERDRRVYVTVNTLVKKRRASAACRAFRADGARGRRRGDRAGSGRRLRASRDDPGANASRVDADGR